MNHRPASSQPHRARLGIIRTRRALTALAGLAVILTTAIGLAPAASARPWPPPDLPAPPPPPPPAAAAPAHLPLWAVVAMVAATVVLSVATTLITLAVEHMRRVRHTSAVAADSEFVAPGPSVTLGPEAGQGEILASHHYKAGHASAWAKRD